MMLYHSDGLQNYASLKYVYEFWDVTQVVTSHVGIIRKELPQHSFNIVVNEASTPPTPPLACSTRASTTHVKTRE